MTITDLELLDAIFPPWSTTSFGVSDGLAAAH